MLWLCRVHTVLDLAAITESVLNISTQSMMPVMTNALRHYLGDSSPIQTVTSIKLLSSQIFRSSINTHFIEHHIPKYYMYYLLLFYTSLVIFTKICDYICLK